MRPEIVPVILAGGRGTRLWPLTSPERPKPLLRLFGPHSLLQQTLLRVRHLGKPLILCHRDHAASVRRHAQEMGISATVLAEAAHGGTALALAVAALSLQQERPDAWMLVLPSDHAVVDTDAFMAALRRAALLAEEEGIVMLGARPYAASSRYGYIRHDGDGRLLGFEEKPCAQRARELLMQGHALWNTGIFLCPPATLLRLLQRHAPAHYAAAKAQGDHIALHSVQPALPPLPIDRAVMEHCTRGRVVLLDAEWSDIGTWPSLIRVWLRLAARLRIHIDPPQALRVSKLK